MPTDTDIFRHAPVLRGRIIPPADSDLRLTYDRFAELDEQARQENWPDGWRMDHDAREANRRAVLKDRFDRDLWVFAYGSLIWDPAVHFDEIRLASISGWQRRFCMWIEGGRGTFERPGLMAALDRGGHCDGVAFRIPSGLVEQETEPMWMREMFSGSYCPTFVEAQTPQGPVEALTFVMDTTNHRYAPGLSDEETARTIATAEGRLGRNFDYLDSLVTHLTDLGIEDTDIRRLHDLALAYQDMQ